MYMQRFKSCGQPILGSCLFFILLKGIGELVGDGGKGRGRERDDDRSTPLCSPIEDDLGDEAIWVRNEMSKSIVGRKRECWHGFRIEYGIAENWGNIVWVSSVG